MAKKRTNHKTKLGLQGPVVAWQDSWAKEQSDNIMRTGTGKVYPSQDATPTPRSFVKEMQGMGAEFYVHHMFPSLVGQSEVIGDMVNYGMDICIGNEYGNINGPYVEGTNRYDVPDSVIAEAARSGRLIGLLYDEPEHLQINASQYRKDGFFPHWAKTDGLTLDQAARKVTKAVANRVKHTEELIRKEGMQTNTIPLVTEQVFPVMFHTQARGGMVVCPKTMKESFQSLQLSTALGAAKQYGKDMWICVDLWGPDVGEWFIRTSGFPGHSPGEYASALRMSYLMRPSHLFTENIDVLLKYENATFSKTVFGEVWDEFVHKYIPENRLQWNHRQVNPDIVFIHSDDSNYGQNTRLFGNRQLVGWEKSQSIFHVWHLLSHKKIPPHGSCMHISGYDFPRHRLKEEVPLEKFPLRNGRIWDGDREHPLFYPVNNVVVYDEFVKEIQLGNPKLLIAAGTRISLESLAALRKKAENGSTVIIAQWLTTESWSESRRVGEGVWLVTENFLEDSSVHETMRPFLGTDQCWMQRFGDEELRIYPSDQDGFELNFERRTIKE
ncbi:hypothetical protein [Bacillus solitudinis]|uniref:hypothetical protein n=1 Tax=Bacillus solitudinis TaxID=2014074 RepID=UPI000C250C31|nr:hypothetical protein [Bacillus solitudinis]